MSLFSVLLCSLLGYHHTLQSPSVSANPLSVQGDVHGGKVAVGGAPIPCAAGTADPGPLILLRTTNPIPPHAERAAAADQFVDSIGINVHLHYDDTLYYTNWPVTLQALQELRVRHVRDAVINNGLQAYYDRHQQLGSLGFKGIYISNASVTPAMLRAFIPRVKNAFEGVETINEADSGTDPNWVSDVKQNLADNYPVAHSFGGLMIGPSLVQTASPSLLGDVSLVADYGNLHNYLAGRNPGTPGWGGPDSLGRFYGSTPFALDNVVNASSHPHLRGCTLWSDYLNVAAVYGPRQARNNNSAASHRLSGRNPSPSSSRSQIRNGGSRDRAVRLCELHIRSRASSFSRRCSWHCCRACFEDAYENSLRAQSVGRTGGRDSEMA
jgi:hypothetical protein